MIIFIALTFITHQTMIYEFVPYQDYFNWKPGFHSIACNGYFIYMGTETLQNNYVSRIFENLDPHSHIKIYAELVGINLLSGGPNSLPPFPQYFLDSQLISDEVKSRNLISNCGYYGSNRKTYKFTTSIIHTHNRRTAWIKIQFNWSGGLIKFQLSILKCQYGCTACIENYPQNCIQWKLHQFSFNQKFIRNSDGWITLTSNVEDLNCGGCQYLRFQVIRYVTILPLHQDVLIRFFKSDTISIIINYKYGSQIITSNQYLIEILIKNHSDSILNLDISTEHPSEYSNIRDFEIFYTLQIQTFNNLNEGCLEQIYNQCLICQDGWILDEYQQNCHPICGDTIIQGLEQCDDYNQIRYDGCYNCMYSCCEFCMNCQFGICKECQDGFIINEYFVCEPFCGDGEVIPYSAEQCEIETDENQNGCQDCRFISISNCKLNYFSNCFECEIGYQNLDNICSPKCGDKIILEQYEDCDDGNQEPYDGCFECKFSCVEGCNTCDKGECLNCDDGYEYGIKDCLSICGNQIITKQEDCDDGNLIQFDGCFNCKYSCPKYCIDCYQGICLQCNDEFLLSSANECQLIQNCGDGFLQENEKCDDGNNLAADGCQNCLIEDNWICSTIKIDSPSICTYVKAPKLIITYLNMTQNKQYISIYLDQQVKIETVQLLSQTMVFELFNINKTNWNSSLQIQSDVGSFLSFGDYILEIEVFQLLDIRPILKIQIVQPVVNYDNVALLDYFKQITLKNPVYLDEQQKVYSKNLKDINRYLIFALSGLTGISQLFGRGDLFVEVLAILQFQQYLKYINLQFPQNLEIYFTFNDMITIQPVLNILQFPQIFEFINIVEGKKYTQGKFIEQNTNLLITLSSQIIQCILFLFFIILLKLIKKALYHRIFNYKYFQILKYLSKYLNSNLVFKFGSWLYNFCLNLIKLEQFLSFKGIQTALLLNGWDMIFKILLYTRNIQINNYYDIIQIVILSIVLLLYFTIILSLFNNQKNFKYSEQRKNKIKRFEMLNFTRSLFFLLFLIYLQNSQILQLGFLLLTSMFQIKNLFIYHKFFKKSQLVVQIVVELSVLIKLSVLLYLSLFLVQFYIFKNFMNFLMKKKKFYQDGFMQSYFLKPQFSNQQLQYTTHILDQNRNQVDNRNLQIKRNCKFQKMQLKIELKNTKKMSILINVQQKIIQIKITRHITLIFSLLINLLFYDMKHFQNSQTNLSLLSDQFLIKFYSFFQVNYIN